MLKDFLLQSGDIPTKLRIWKRAWTLITTYLDSFDSLGGCSEIIASLLVEVVDFGQMNLLKKYDSRTSCWGFRSLQSKCKEIITDVTEITTAIFQYFDLLKSERACEWIKKCK